MHFCLMYLWPFTLLVHTWVLLMKQAAVFELFEVIEQMYGSATHQLSARHPSCAV